MDRSQVCDISDIGQAAAAYAADVIQLPCVMQRGHCVLSVLLLLYCHNAVLAILLYSCRHVLPAPAPYIVFSVSQWIGQH